MSLEKLRIKYETVVKNRFSGTIEALFNPNQLSFRKDVQWDFVDSAWASRQGAFKRASFRSIGQASLTINLFFDTYEGDPNSALGLLGAARSLTTPLATTLLSTPDGVSVLKYTEQVAALTRYNREFHRPPICELRWGNYFLFRGVLSGLTQDFTLFLSDGTPVRATLGCTFQQYQSSTDALRFELHSADVAKTYTVRPGDTLSSIAASVYEDDSLWRHIAEANDIENPRAIVPGQTLTIPPLR